MFVDGRDVVALLENVVADALGCFGQRVFIDGLQAVVVFVCFFVGRDAVVGGVERALEGGYGGCGWVRGCCEVYFVTNLPLQWMDRLGCHMLRRRI
jgi:hypothetical protein